MNGKAVKVAGAALATLSAIALLTAAIMLLNRGNDAAPVRIIAPEPAAGNNATTPTGNDTTPASASAAPSPNSQAHITGAVMSPGIYPINPGDRLLDLIDVAGGLTPNADPSGLNLSIQVNNATRYRIPELTGPGTNPNPTTSNNAPAPAPGSNDNRLNLNTASSPELETLPGIGPALAAAIIAYRQANGPFTAINQLDNVPGIGPKTLENLRPLVTASPN